MDDMKTLEDKAFELYPDVSFKKDVESEDTFRTNEIRLLERAAFIYGYNEATRWRDPKSEPPQYYVEVFIKIKEPVAFDYYVAFLSKYKGNDIFLTEYNTYIEVKNVAGWRPIE